MSGIMLPWFYSRLLSQAVHSLARYHYDSDRLWVREEGGKFVIKCKGLERVVQVLQGTVLEEGGFQARLSDRELYLSACISSELVLKWSLDNLEAFSNNAPGTFVQIFEAELILDTLAETDDAKLLLNITKFEVRNGQRESRIGNPTPIWNSDRLDEVMNACKAIAQRQGKAVINSEEWQASKAKFRGPNSYADVDLADEVLSQLIAEREIYDEQALDAEDMEVSLQGQTTELRNAQTESHMASSQPMNTKQSTGSARKVYVDSESSMPDHWGKKYSRRDGMISSEQAKLLKSIDGPWLPAPPGQRAPLASIPSGILQEIINMNEGSQLQPSNPASGHEPFTQKTVYPGPGEWPSSPERGRPQSIASDRLSTPVAPPPPRKIVLPPDSDDDVPIVRSRTRLSPAEQQQAVASSPHFSERNIAPWVESPSLPPHDQQPQCTQAASEAASAPAEPCSTPADQNASLPARSRVDSGRNSSPQVSAVAELFVGSSAINEVAVSPDPEPSWAIQVPVTISRPSSKRRADQSFSQKSMEDPKHVMKRQKKEFLARCKADSTSNMTPGKTLVPKSSSDEASTQKKVYCTDRVVCSPSHRTGADGERAAQMVEDTPIVAREKSAQMARDVFRRFSRGSTRPASARSSRSAEPRSADDRCTVQAETRPAQARIEVPSIPSTPAQPSAESKPAATAPLPESPVPATQPTPPPSSSVASPVAAALPDAAIPVEDATEPGPAAGTVRPGAADDTLGAFRSAYPDYGGDRRHLARVCALLQGLGRGARPPRYAFDHFVLCHRAQYAPYLARVAAEGCDALPYHEWYADCAGNPGDACRGILGVEQVEEWAGIYEMEFEGRRERETREKRNEEVDTKQRRNESDTRARSKPEDIEVQRASGEERRRERKSRRGSEFESSKRKSRGASEVEATKGKKRHEHNDRLQAPNIVASVFKQFART